MVSNSNSNSDSQYPLLSSSSLLPGHSSNEPSAHKSLQGPTRLFSVVQNLGESCPWTASVDAPTMLSWLESEIAELSEEIRRADCTEEIISELGDILFDALMLEMICRKTYEFSPQTAWETAANKVERRTPYMNAWGDGVSTARTPEECEAFWKAAKALEPKKEKEKKDRLRRVTSSSRFFRISSQIIPAAAIGFSLGILVSTRYFGRC